MKLTACLVSHQSLLILMLSSLTARRWVRFWHCDYLVVEERGRYHYENKPIQIYWHFYHQKNENFQIKNSDIFHISAQNIDCGYSLEPPRRILTEFYLIRSRVKIRSLLKYIKWNRKYNRHEAQHSSDPKRRKNEEKAMAHESTDAWTKDEEFQQCLNWFKSPMVFNPLTDRNRWICHSWFHLLHSFLFHPIVWLVLMFVLSYLTDITSLS